MTDYPGIETVCAGCDLWLLPVDACKEECCPYRWQRQGHEDRARREELDRHESETRHEE